MIKGAVTCGGRSQRIRNVVAKGSAVVVHRKDEVVVRPVELPASPDRGAAIAELSTQAIPGGAVVWRPLSHLEAVGVYLRIGQVNHDAFLDGRGS